VTDIANAPADAIVATWFKSSYSGGEGNECVEIADLRTQVAVRDSKVPHGYVLTLSAVAFATFVGGIAKAAEIFGTTTQAATVNAALEDVIKGGKRASFLGWLAEGGLPDLTGPLRPRGR